MPLTDKQQRFVEEYCIDFNGSQAAIRAGYSKKTSAAIASELLTKAVVSDALRVRMEKLAERCAVTIETITEQLLEDRQLAHKAIQPGAAVSASMGMAKLHGLIVDRNELSGKDGAPLAFGKIEIELVDPSNPQSADPT